MRHTESPSGNIREIRGDIMLLRDNEFFTQNFGSLTHLNDIADEMVYYYDNIDKLPSVVARMRDGKAVHIETERLELLYLMLTFIDVCPAASSRVIQKVEEIRASSDMYDDEEVNDREFTDILKQANIHPLLVHILNPEEIADLKNQLNNVRDDQICLETISNKVFNQLEDPFSFEMLGANGGLEAYRTAFLLRVRLLKAYPVGEESGIPSIPGIDLIFMDNEWEDSGVSKERFMVIKQEMKMLMSDTSLRRFYMLS